MPNLYLLRHAKAEEPLKHAFNEEDDRNRHLTKGGVKDADRVGEWFASKSIKPGVVLVSDSQRTKETWQKLSDRLGDQFAVRVLQSLYNAAPELVLEQISSISSSFTSCLLIGHNPALSEIAGASLRPASLAYCEWKGDWKEIERYRDFRWKVKDFRD
jgi:phosphohistidine phosphatase